MSHSARVRYEIVKQQELSSERVTLRMPAGDEAEFLRLDTEQRVIEVERVARNTRGRAVEVNVIVMPRTSGAWSTNGPPKRTSPRPLPGRTLPRCAGVRVLPEPGRGRR
jgi:hypothetical protein